MDWLSSINLNQIWLFYRAAQIIEREKLLQEASTSDLEPSTDFHIRNRYLSRIGESVSA